MKSYTRAVIAKVKIKFVLKLDISFYCTCTSKSFRYMSKLSNEWPLQVPRHTSIRTYWRNSTYKHW